MFELRLDLEKLPPIIGVPLEQAAIIPLFSVEWQVALLLKRHASRRLFYQLKYGQEYIKGKTPSRYERFWCLPIFY